MRTFRSLALLVVTATTLVGCGGSVGSDPTVYTDPSRTSLFRVPQGWHVYDTEEMSELPTFPFVHTVDTVDLPVVHIAAFDGAPARNVGNLSDELASVDVPVGAVTIRSIGSSERDFVSRNLLVQSVLPYHARGNAQEITKEDFSFGRGFEGVRILVAYQDGTGPDVGVAYLISVTDSDTRQMYSIVAGCSQECFVANQQTIEELVDSWLVNTRA